MDTTALYVQQLAATAPVDPDEEKRLLSLVRAGQAAQERLSTAPPDQQTRLHRQVQAGQDARHRLIEANGRLVLSVARHYLNRGLPLEELCQEGIIGLMRAIDKWRPDRGASKLSTYAVWWIRQGMQRAVIEQGHTIRLPVHQYDRLKRIRRTGTELHTGHGLPPTAAEIALALDEKPETVELLLQAGMTPACLDQPVGCKGGEQMSLMEVIPTGEGQVSGEVELSLLRSRLVEVLEKLDPREARILKMRYGIEPYTIPHTLQEVAERFGLCRERIRQVEQEALARLRRLPQVRQMRTFVGG